MTTTDAIVALLTAKAAALVARDPAALAALIDDGFVYVNASGRRFDKTGYVAAFGGSGAIAFERQRFDDISVSDFGTFAVATMRVHDRFTHPEGVFEGTFLALGVFGRTDAGWRWAAGQTMTPPSH